MNISENKLRKQQEYAITIASRRAINDGDPMGALLLAKRVPSFWPSHLITIMIIAHGQFSNRSSIFEQAMILFRKYVGLCAQPAHLTESALWVRNPIREKSLPIEFKSSIDDRRKFLEPGWNGIWENPASEQGLVLAKRPEEVFDTRTCLVAASQTRNWNPWLARYRALGGSFEHPRYLKILVARAVARDKEPSRGVKSMLKKYTKVAATEEVRAFLRHITPTKKRKRRDPNWKLAKYALLLYCGLERLEYDIEDWMHIAKSALYLDYAAVQRISQRGLASLNRTPEAQRVFEELTAIHGIIPVTQCPKDDIGLQGNPIWENVYYLLPVDANARKILVAYSQRETSNS